MELYVLNRSLERIGVIDTYTSLIWAKRYYAAGDFELYLPASAAAVELLQEDYYLQRDDDDTVMIIEKIGITTDAESGNFLTVSGRSLESILARRIIWEQTTANGAFAPIVYMLIRNNAINTAADRIIPRLEIDVNLNFSDVIQTQYTGDNLYEAIATLCQTYGHGWKIALTDEKFVFSLYDGTDRSYGNAAGNPFVVFSPEFDNLTNSSYQHDKTNYKNVALVLGEGEGTARARATVGSAVGLDRYEMYVDARDVSSNDGEIDATAYGIMLTERGAQNLAENGITTAYDGEASANGVYQYKRDFLLGDIVQIENEYRMQAKARIIEIIETDDENGRHIVPTFEKIPQPIYVLVDSAGYVLRDSTGAVLTVEV